MYFDDLVETYYEEYREQDMFHDLMRYRVNEVLLVASLFTSFVIKQDGALSEQIYGEFFSLNLTTIPRVSCAYTHEAAKEMFSGSSYDMVIIMAGLDFEGPITLAKTMKEQNPKVPILLLAMNNSSLAGLDPRSAECTAVIDRVFVWNGYSKLFLGMIKYIEDLYNVDNDTKNGMVQVILLVENSIRYYSRYMPLLYSAILTQTQILIEEERAVEINKIRKMRWRPKIILATNYEDALELFNRYEQYILTVISDIRYSVGGIEDSEAGFKLLAEIKTRKPETPVLLQSSDAENRSKAYAQGAAFTDKNSNTLTQELISFFQTHLGYGSFIFRTPDGVELSQARNMDEFEYQIRTCPGECLIYHGSNNHFSTWFMARGEMSTAKILRSYGIESFETPDALRDFLLKILLKVKKNRVRGNLPLLNAQTGREKNQDAAAHYLPTHRLVRLGGGSIGGKGRGVAFIGSLIENLALTDLQDKIEIQIPYTGFIGIDEFEKFMDINGLWGFSWFDKPDIEMRKMFLSMSLSRDLIERLRHFLETTDRPLAVRSSGLFEDMLMVSFSGVYDTYVIPNTNPDIETRLSELCDAIRLVYASLYSESARHYFDAASYKIGEERMAVIIQECVGTRQGRWYYPIISGIAQSYNYYPFSYLKPDDGLCVTAIGCGCHVVDGESAYRFSPRYPKVDVNLTGAQTGGTQRTFYALDLERPADDLISGVNSTLECLDISEAESNEHFAMTASTYNREDDRLEAGIGSKGPRIINFAPILKNNLFPLAEMIDAVLDIGSKSMGLPVEIEFALNMENEKPVFYFLQLKPLIQNTGKQNTDLGEYKTEDCLVISLRSMGNGRDTSISDIIWIDPEVFSSSKTVAMAAEIEKLNGILKKLDRRYVLLGPGRWGTRDFALGIPVNFSQISQSRVIVEADLPNFTVEPSLGSHFFHNVTSMNIGYLSVARGRGKNHIDWEWLKSLHCEKKLKYARWSKTEQPLNIVMDGRIGNTVIFKQ